ncbi:MAG: hypothetical protein WC208_06285, partial [Gallionella sp.]
NRSSPYAGLSLFPEGGSVQQGLSAAYAFIAMFKFRCAADKRYTLELHMIRWGLLLLAVIVNLFWVATSQGGCFVSWAQIVPKEISCALCSQPEVQAALIRAVELGRQQMCNSLPNIWLVICVAVFNLLVIAVLLFVPALTLRSSGTAQKRAAP